MALAVAASAAAVARGAEREATVSVASGRQFQGQIDPASTFDRLVLRTTNGGITLRRPIQWQQINSARCDGQPVEIDALRASLSRAVDRPARLIRRIELSGLAAAPGPSPTPAGEASSPREPGRVASITFDATIANWDADVETDGLALTVAPLDVDRFLIPVDAAIEVELFVPQRRALDQAPQSGGDTLELVERWTRSIRAEDFAPSGARLRLPFGAITPELVPDWTASMYGLVHVRLAIPGQGVFEDSRDAVRIRPWAPNRDRLEMKTQQRYLPTENLGRRE